jgi:serine/threonine protein kinase
MNRLPDITEPCTPWPFLAPPQGAGEIGRLAQYRVLKLLGRGGMGMVFQAEDTQLRRPVALKVMLPEVAAQQQSKVRFLREARAAAALKHDHVVTIYQVGEDRGVPFLAMEFLRGKSLADWLASGRQASVAETLIIGRQIAKGLAAAHQAGLIHRDIKPANLWLEAPAGRVKVLDFGLARWADGQPDGRSVMRTEQGAVVGTPAFMAPEQARGEEVNARSDLFSLGCVLYRLAAGRPPFAGDTMVAVLSAVLTQEPRPVRELNPQVPERLAGLIARLLAKQPGERPASAQVVADELLAIHQERKASADTATLEGSETIHLEPGTSGAMPAAGAHPRHRLRVAVALVLGGLAMAALVALAVSNWNSQQPTVVKNPDQGGTAQPTPIQTPAPQTAQPVDLLALIDIARDTKGGRWARPGGTLTVGQKGEPARFVTTIPWDPPTEYRLRMVVEHRGGKCNLGIALASGDARFNMVIDTEAGERHLSGLALVDGRVLDDRGDAWVGKVMSRGIPVELVITVRKERVTLEVADKLLYAWSGELARTARPSRHRDTPLALFGNGPGAMQFHKIVLEPLGDDRGRPLEDDATSAKP